jgi:hypothetical protein
VRAAKPTTRRLRIFIRRALIWIVRKLGEKAGALLGGFPSAEQGKTLRIKTASEV